MAAFAEVRFKGTRKGYFAYEALEHALDELGRIKTDRLRKLRWAKYEAMGAWGESTSDTPTDS